MFFERCEQGFCELIKFKTSNGCYRRGIVFLARFQRGCWTLVTINNTEKKQNDVNDHPRPISRPA